MIDKKDIFMSGFKKRAGLKGGVWFEIDELLDKMQELEKGDK